LSNYFLLKFAFNTFISQTFYFILDLINIELDKGNTNGTIESLDIKNIEVIVINETIVSKRKKEVGPWVREPRKKRTELRN